MFHPDALAADYDARSRTGLSPAKSGEYPGEAGGRGLPATSGEYPAKPVEGG